MNDEDKKQQLYLTWEEYELLHRALAHYCNNLSDKIMDLGRDWPGIANEAQAELRKAVELRDNYGDKG